MTMAKILIEFETEFKIIYMLFIHNWINCYWVALAHLQTFLKQFNVLCFLSASRTQNALAGCVGTTNVEVHTASSTVPLYR